MPENYAPELAANTPLMTHLRAFVNAGGVILAESGGLLYLSQSI